MKQVIPFIKDISFNTRISEITSIALEHNLKMENNDSIVGVFAVSGKYKINEISINEESFNNDIPFDITLDDKYDASKVKIDIDDFYYEVINEELLRVHIDVLIDNLVYYKKQPIIEERTQEIEEINLPTEAIEDNEVREDIVTELNTNIEEERKDIKANISTNFINQEEKYVTYKIHIVRENDTIESIIELYNVSKEELVRYNQIDIIKIGDKIIIPLNNE